MINIKENEKLNILNHSCAHLLAHAVKHLYPNALFWVGPVIEEGFYYDIDLGDNVIKEEDLNQIEKEMKKISKSNKLIKRIELSKSDALDMFKTDPYKIDLIENMDYALYVKEFNWKVVKIEKIDGTMNFVTKTPPVAMKLVIYMIGFVILFPVLCFIISLFL